MNLFLDTASSPKKHENKFNHLRPLTGDSFFLDLKKSDDLHEVKEKIVAYGGVSLFGFSLSWKFIVTAKTGSVFICIFLGLSMQLKSLHFSSTRSRQTKKIRVVYYTSKEIFPTSTFIVFYIEVPP